ncbi:hypothetical protein BV898_13473 [Hypsibius exemplaris]|uniref:Uncharacterized protein n=1 Tax=Hypsibius exemplaris TaxID=2072580 RepID=A0A1W0WAT5_HYPEX|nr:hypothetical protein BV898_13473 [Hypsibius exemplaris]
MVLVSESIDLYQANAATRSSTAELETGGLKNPVNVSNFTSTSNDSVPVNDLAKETADFIKSLDHEGLRCLKQRRTISKTQLGKYITQLHSYWKKANPDMRNRFRNSILKQIDGLNVPIGIQHAIQEVLPGLVAG